MHGAELASAHTEQLELRRELQFRTERCVSPGAGRARNPLADIPRWRIEHLVGTGVHDLDLYHVALTSPAAVPEDLSVERSFDRLEFLGDAVIECVVKEWIYRK